MAKAAQHIRMYITEKCNARCRNCFNSSLRSRAEMSIERFEKLCAYLSMNGVSHVKIMGGEPTVHPDFCQLIQIAQSYFKQLSIFTNAINNEITKITSRDTDSIIYNFKFSKAINHSKLLLEYPGKRALEVQVLDGMNINNVKSEILRIYNIDPEIEVYLTLDCMSDIFSTRDNIIPLYKELQDFCTSNNITQGQDHILPFCYVKGTNIPIPYSGAICSIECAGLIDANYNFRYCNQYPEILGNIFDEHGHIINWQNVISSLTEKHKIILDERRSMKCSNCPFWQLYCNGGCYIK